MLVWLVLACGGAVESPVDTVVDTGDERPDEYVVPEGQSTVLLTVEEVAHGIEVGLETMRLLDPADVQTYYLSLVGGSDESCPEWKDTFYEGTYNYWKDACTSETGTIFSGWAKQQRPYDYQDGNHHYVDDGYLEGEFEISQPGGFELEFSGKVSYWERTLNYYKDPEDADPEHDYDVYASGDVTLRSAGEEDTWLTSSFVYDYDIYFKDYDDDEGMSASWDGGIFGIEGDTPAIYASDFYIYSAAKGSPCEQEPSGLVAVRDSLGQWYDVEFQGPPYSGAWSYQPECDGCGDVWFRGEFLGEACVDFSIFMEWDGEGRPW